MGLLNFGNFSSDKLNEYYSGGDNPSKNSNQYDWVPQVGQIGGSLIGGMMFGPMGSFAGGAIGRDAGNDISRIAEGDDLAKVAFDRIINLGSKNPFLGTSMPASGLLENLLTPLAKSFLGWK